MATSTPLSSMPAIVLVHGAWHGGWCYQRVAAKLRQQGHLVYTPTFTGLGERAHLAHPGINASTHVQDIQQLIRYEGLTDIVLVGHSYGGLIITAVADQDPARIRALVYLDAYIGEDGKSLFDLDTPAASASYLKQAQQHGGHVPPVSAASFGVNEADQAWVDARCTPGSFACWTERLALSGRHRDIRQRHYVFATGWSGPFVSTYQQVCAEGGWHTAEFDCGHDLMLDRPDDTAAVIDRAARLTLA